MIVQQRSLFRLLILRSAFSASLRSSGNPAFLSARTRVRAQAPSPWATRGKAHHYFTLDDTWRNVSSVLVCGDGDLSYSAWLAEQLAETGVSLTATVLETEPVHKSVYKNSQRHADRIASFVHHKVCFGIDATQLPTHFANTAFDRIIFNFPHWRGKANNKRNRELLDAFLASASQVLQRDGGLVQIAFCEGQGGATASTEVEWKQSWTAALYAAEHGLMLINVEPFEPGYDLSSHRGVDRPFRIGSSPERYSFALPNGEPVEPSIQLCCRHELHLVVPDDECSGSFNRESLVNGNTVLELVREIVPSGIRVEVPIRQILSSSETGGRPEMIVFLIVYCGESKELTRLMADEYRDKLETEISKHGVQVRENRRGRPVSRPFPYPLLPQLIKKQLED